MNTDLVRIDAHPEELIDRQKRGLLTAAEGQELAFHLARCSACAAEVWAHTREKAAGDLATRPGDAALDIRAVSGALLALGARPSRASSLRRRWLWALVAMFPLTAMAAAMGARLRSQPQRVPALPASPTLGAPAVAPSLHDPSVDTAAPKPFETTSAIGSPVHSPSPEVARAPARAERSERTESAPAELFRRAGELERAGKRGAAVDVYEELERRFASSPEANLSYAVAGRLLLDQGKYRNAIAQFDHYLSSGGPASEEALAGRAAALQGTGDATGEAGTWRTLLSRFPRSVHAARAQQRLLEIGGSADLRHP